LQSQTLGGNTVFNFLNLPNTPQLTAMGGVNTSFTSNDVGLAFNDPALLTAKMHSQMNAVFNSFYGGIKAVHLSLGYRSEPLNTNFLWGIHYLNYGNVTQTDAAGNIFGNFRATDWVMQVSASRQYMGRWHYGATLKFINSTYGSYHSSGVAMDVGVLYKDSVHQFSAGLLAKNMGFQIKKYEGASAEDLPFDVQIGISKRLEKAPFGFTISVHHLHQFDIRYNDTVFNSENVFNQNKKTGSFTLDKFFRHFVAATHIYIGDHVEATVAYNHLRRQELNIGNASNGLNGFSMGMGVMLNKLQFHYARAWYQNNTAYNQFGLNMKLDEFFGLGKLGAQVGW
jgi:hypothetical protein